jgi:hypothetical protein
VALGDKTLLVKDANGCERVGTVEKVDTVDDLAFVQIEVSANMNVSPLSCRVPPIGLPIAMVGHPFGREFVVMNGTVATGVRKWGAGQAWS